MRKALFITFLLYAGSIFASSGIISHEYIVKLREHFSIKDLASTSAHLNIAISVLNQEQRIFLFIFDTSKTKSEEVHILNGLQFITSYHSNQKLVERTCKPNDPFFNQQWNMSFMGFEEIWCFDNNGITPLGDTIVIGIIDQGCNCDITDIHSNLFINYNEIPNNKIDDDSNGYIDDYRGFNAVSGKDDKHPKDNHGTNILSIAGAKGNNEKFISGAAQNIKMLMCSATSEADAIECYTYFIKMKQAYFASKGGAYIVSSTTSLGLPRAFPEDHNDWCDLYDVLGSNGILNVCATDNEDENIDEYGDIPGLCTSEYLIVVTNTDRSDSRAVAAFSKINVDIAASGEQVPVINQDSSVSNSSGCSLSAPQVGAGSAYLHQFCEKYAKFCKTSPGQSALLMKSFIYNGSKAISSLSSEISTGKRFDVNGSFLKLLEYCEVLSSENDLIVYNDPSYSGELKYDVKLTKYGPFELNLYNSNGQHIYRKSGNYTGQDRDIKAQLLNTKSLSSGLYILTLRVGDNLISRKFVTIH
ncbi:MAG: S8 family serine peptidase [Saprospiraceae bacterium]|nr:S8 family serine peptidase [Saprospiraceae bacterium]